MQQLTAGSDQLNFPLGHRLPLFSFDAAENKWNAFIIRSRVRKRRTVAKLEAGDFAHVRAEAYERRPERRRLGGGSIRIHEPDLQAKAFAALGVSEEDQQSLFGHLLRRLPPRAPPHGGIAFGLDRIVMISAR